ATSSGVGAFAVEDTSQQVIVNNPSINTPASVACIYGLVPKTLGCRSHDVLRTARGGSGVIAIVDVGYYPTALADLQTFSKNFGVPRPKFKNVFCNSTACGVATHPPFNEDANGETALDLDWAHAMAPSAELVLVSVNSFSFNDLMVGVDYAARVAAKAGGQVSMSIGGPEFSGQTTLDHNFVKRGATFFLSSGDHKCPGGGDNCADVNWPATSPNVVAAGGTTIVRDSGGNFLGETPWIDGGGGLSAVYSRPAFQNGVAARVGNSRGVPDVALIADPATGVVVICSQSSCGNGFEHCTVATCGFDGDIAVIGGTSLSAPALAGITNNAGKSEPSSAAEQRLLYKELGGARLNDIKTGQCKNGPGGAVTNALTGWDVCTGVGTPKGKTAL
ncbi:MAG TPA: S53 family peptidase, partial [Pirellulales bacterium]|nr:S53 family peptidase [Pirellulales bacterium]